MSDHSASTTFPGWARKTAAIVATGLGLLAASPAPAQDGPSPGVPAITAHAVSANFLGTTASDDARRVADWVLESGDNHDMPFVIVDKKDTRVFVFGAQGRLVGATPALLGLARGDDSAPGIGDRKLSEIRPQERTTPAGRFVASLGHDLGKQDILWVDYGAALSLHRVLPADSKEHRLERLAAVSPLDHRITFGCINVPVTFYDSVVHPVFTGTSGIVYILPEVKSLGEVFFASAS